MPGVTILAADYGGVQALKRAQPIETAQRCRTISFKSDYLGNCTLDQCTSLEFFLCLRPTVLLLKFRANRICRFRDQSSMTGRITSQSDLSSCPSTQQYSERPRRATRWLQDGRWAPDGRHLQVGQARQRRRCAVDVDELARNSEAQPACCPHIRAGARARRGVEDACQG